MSGTSDSVRLSVPGSSANLGPGFDAIGMALNLSLEIEAELADGFMVHASGRSPEICGALSNNLVLMTYTEVLGGLGLPAPPLQLRIRNNIPLGVGCGSSAAALVAGVLLARHFGALSWGRDDVLREAALREGHPDNVAASLIGGVVVAGSSAGGVWARQIADSVLSRIYLALPPLSLSTSEARAVLPEAYKRRDAVTNLQNCGLLVLSFAKGRLELLRIAMRDTLHEPYREPLCPLYKRLQPLREHADVYGIALSGAGPAVLVFAKPEFPTEEIYQLAGPELSELVEVKAAPGAMT